MATITSAASFEPGVAALRKAAAQGHAQSQVESGILCMLGIGVPRNDGIAKRWLRRAAEQGLPHAYLELGCLCATQGAGSKDSDIWLSNTVGPKIQFVRAPAPSQRLAAHQASSRQRTYDHCPRGDTDMASKKPAILDMCMLSESFWISATKAERCRWKTLRRFIMKRFTFTWQLWSFCC